MDEVELGDCTRLACRIIELAVNDWKVWRRFTPYREQNRRYKRKPPDPPWVQELYGRALRYGYASPRDQLIAFFRGAWCRFLWDSTMPIPIEHMYKELNIDNVQICKIPIGLEGGRTVYRLHFKPKDCGEDG